MSFNSAINFLNKNIGPILVTGILGVFAFFIQGSIMLSSTNYRLSELEIKSESYQHILLDQTKQLVRIAEIINQQDERNGNFKDQFRDIMNYIDREITRSSGQYGIQSDRMIEQFKLLEREYRILQDDVSRLKAIVEIKNRTEVEH